VSSPVGWSPGAQLLDVHRRARASVRSHAVESSLFAFLWPDRLRLYTDGDRKHYLSSEKLIDNSEKSRKKNNKNLVLDFLTVFSLSKWPYQIQQ
jgi:hypothetical protein